MIHPVVFSHFLSTLCLKAKQNKPPGNVKEINMSHVLNVKLFLLFKLAVFR